jgi:hypothetical protein
MRFQVRRMEAVDFVAPVPGLGFPRFLGSGQGRDSFLFNVN